MPRLGRVPLTGALWTLLGVLTAGVLLRLWFLGSEIGTLDGDEAVTGVMAQRILDGDHYVWFAGQRYMGTIEQYLQALSLAILPDTPTTLRLPQVALAVATALVCFAIARRATASAGTGVVAAAAFLFGPLGSLTWTTRSRGAYAIATFAAVVGVWAALRISDEPRRWVWLSVLGGACGVAAWCQPIAGWLLVPAVVAAAGAVGWRSLGRAALPFVGGAVLGALPMLIDTIANGLPEITASGAPATVAQRSERVTLDLLPSFLGAKIVGGWLVERLPLAVVVVGAVMALGAAIWERRRGLVALVTLRARAVQAVDVVLLAFPVAAVVYALSSSGNFGDDPRYLTPLYPALALLVALAFARWRRAGPLVLAGFLVWSIAGIALSERRAVNGREFSAQVSPTGWPDSGITRDAVDVLADRGERAVWAEYWLAYPMAFAAGGRLDVAPIGFTRFHEEAERVRAADRVAYAAQFGQPALALRTQLTASGITWTEIEVGEGPSRIYLFVELSRPVRPSVIGLPEVG